MMKITCLLILMLMVVTVCSQTYTVPSKFGVNKYSQTPYVSIILNEKIDKVWKLMRRFDKSVAIMSAAPNQDSFQVTLAKGCSTKEVGAIIKFNPFPGVEVKLRQIELSDYQFRRRFEIFGGSYPGTSSYQGTIELVRVYLPGEYDHTLFQIYQEYTPLPGANSTAIYEAIMGTMTAEALRVSTVFGRPSYRGYAASSTLHDEEDD